MSLGPEWKYHISIEHEDWYEVQLWCDEFIGKFDEDWYKLGIDPLARFNGNPQTTWYFKREQDIILFKLRWQ